MCTPTKEQLQSVTAKGDRINSPHDNYDDIAGRYMDAVHEGADARNRGLSPRPAKANPFK